MKSIQNKTDKKSKSYILTLLLFLFMIGASPCVWSQNHFFGDDLNDLDYSNPRTYEIGGITVSGVQHLDKNVLIMLSGLSVGDQISIPGDKISSAIKKLWKQNLFENIQIVVTKTEGKYIFLELQFEERPRLSKYILSGVKRSESDKIKEALNLVRGDVVTDNLKVSSLAAIKKHLQEKGYLNAEISIKEIPDTSKMNHVALEFKIDKKSRIKIEHINIIGNKEISSHAARKSFKNTKEKVDFKPLNSAGKIISSTFINLYRLNPEAIIDTLEQCIADDYRVNIFKRSKFIKDEFEEDKVRLIEKYNAHGFRNSKIIDDYITFNDNNTIDVNVVVEEGNRCYFRDIKWIGNTKYPTSQLNDIFAIRKGDVFNQDLLNRKINLDPNGLDISSLYLDNGYLFFHIIPIETNVENDSIDMEMRIYEGEQARINNVILSGNTRTNDYVVLREIYTKPGRLFSRSEIIRSVRELSQLQYFNQETIQPIPKADPLNNQVDIEYKVEETSSDKIELSGGWGYGRLIGTLGLTFNNFSTRSFFNKSSWRPIPIGDGQKLSLRLQSYGQGYLSFSSSFTEPWLGGTKPTSLTLSYYCSMMRQTYSKKELAPADPWSILIQGFSVGLGKRLKWPDDYFTLYQSANFQQYKLKNYQMIALHNGNGRYNTISYNIIFGRNSIDAPIYPRNGSDLSLSVELTPPYSMFNDKDYSALNDQEKFKWMEFHKWKVKGSWFKQLAGDLVISFRTQYGFLGSYNRDIGVTPFNRFFLGGDGMMTGGGYFDGREIIGMRGYTNLSLTPDYYNNNNIGGNVYNKNTIEVRYPVSLNPSATIFALAFLEAGNTWKNFQNFKPLQLYRSAGFGVRVFLPIFGMIGLDWGKGFDDVPGLKEANKGQFHFSIGQTID